jgi:hypothetical protein
MQPVLAVSTAAMTIGIIVLAGLVLIGVVWDLAMSHLERQEQSIYDRESHRTLMRELRRQHPNQ